MQLLAKKPAERPASADTVVQALQKIEAQAGIRVAGSEPGNRAPVRTGGPDAGQTLLYPPTKKRQPRPWLVVSALLCLGALGAGVVWFRLPPRGSVESAADATTRVELTGMPESSPGLPKPKPTEPVSSIDTTPPLEAELRRAYKNSTGNWKIDGDELVQESPSAGDSTLVFGDFAWKDYDFACEGKKISGGGEFGLVYRVTNSGRGEYLLGRWKGTWESAGSMDLGKYQRLRQRDTGKPVEDRWYKLRMRIRGAHFQCFRDDQPVFDFDDPKNPQGGVGLRTWNTAARFRNLRVTDPAGKVLLEGFPRLPARSVQWIRGS